MEVYIMKSEELKKICEQYPDFEFEFKFTDGYSRFPNIRTFNHLELTDVGHSEKIIVLFNQIFS